MMSGENGLSKAMTGPRVAQHEALSSIPTTHVKKKKKKARQCTFAFSALLQSQCQGFGDKCIPRAQWSASPASCVSSSSVKNKVDMGSELSE